MSRKPDAADAAKASIYASVGYGRPPREHQFQKGQSGNPPGRPRKAQKLLQHLQQQGTDAGFDSQLDRNQADMRRVRQETVEVRKGGKAVTVSKAEALQRVLEKMALAGESILAIRDVRAQMLADDARRRAEIEEDHKFCRSYIAAYAKAKADADKRGKTLTEFWILPEDIAFAPGFSVRIRGPLTQADVSKHALLQDLAKAILASQLYAMFTSGYGTPHQERAMLVAGSALWAYITSHLSTRMAADRDAYRGYLEDLALVRGHKALRIELTQAWARLGLKTPPLEVFRSPSKKLLTMARKLDAVIPECVLP